MAGRLAVDGLRERHSGHAEADFPEKRHKRGGSLEEREKTTGTAKN